MKLFYDKSLTDVPYFKAIGIHSGLKRKRNDLCVIYSEKPCISAATFTTNKVKAAPVLLDMEHIKNDKTYAIVVNSGNANACNGDNGYKNALSMAKCTADSLNIKAEEVLVCSTGVIGVPLPMDIVLPGIKEACSKLSLEGGHEAAKAIMTTDTIEKRVAVEFLIGEKKAIISAMAKGSGMIHPNMGTMLSFIATNVNIDKNMLSKALKESVEDSYNMISVDGDTSTNDTVIILANGSLENPVIDEKNEDYDAFKKALHTLDIEIAKMIAKDGEGATKLIETKVLHAPSLTDAKISSKAVIKSSLVKAAIFGSDPNWGRVICALGYSGANINPNNVDIFFSNSKGSVQTCKNGTSLEFDKNFAIEILNEPATTITIDLHDGDFNATAWGCDLTYEYVKINGCYTT